MKLLCRLCVASLLTLTLSLSAFAGVMSTTVASPPPPEGGEMSTTVTSQGAVIGSEGTSALVSVTEAALNALQSVLALF